MDVAGDLGDIRHWWLSVENVNTDVNSGRADRIAARTVEEADGWTRYRRRPSPGQIERSRLETTLEKSERIAAHTVQADGRRGVEPGVEKSERIAARTSKDPGGRTRYRRLPTKCSTA
ncbi:MAG TPA: hypothetical protein VF469_26230 [Kofleriaceae bacterium]